MLPAIIGIGALLCSAALAVYLSWKVLKEDRAHMEDMIRSANSGDDRIERWQEEWKRKYKL
jgi:hypothetical protein